MSDISNGFSNRKKIPYPGKNKIFLNGSIVTSPNAWWILLTLSLLIGPSIYLIVFIFPEAIKIDMLVLTLPYALFFFLIPYYCLKTAWTDPGIIPRLTNPVSSIKEDNPDEYDESGRIIGKLLYHQLNENFVVGKQVLVEDKYVFLKYCHTCEIFRPPKASHCHHCDNCVEEFDHHCHWLSNCIGRRNYKSFFLFVFYLSIAAIYNSIFMAIFIYRHKASQSTFIEAAKNLLISTGAYFFLFSLAVGLILAFLFFYHLMLLGNDLTTAEHVKKVKSSTFSWKTCKSNLIRIFFHPIPDAQISWDLYTHRSKHNETQVV